MKKMFYPLVMLAVMIQPDVHAQQSLIKLTFTAVNDTVYVPLDSIRIFNMTRNCDTVLYFPDTTLILGYTGIDDHEGMTESAFRLMQNYPNPVSDHATVDLYVPSAGEIVFTFTDLTGRQLFRKTIFLPAGFQSLTLIPGKEQVQLMTAAWRNERQTITVLSQSSTQNMYPGLIYKGEGQQTPIVKSTGNTGGFLFLCGDGLLYTGYYDGLASGIADNPDSILQYSFQFATNIPCPGSPTITYGGKTYATVQVFSQCWMQQNLDYGTMIPDTVSPADNQVAEKWCLGNAPAYCNLYGALYQWNELMQYTVAEGSRGLCPEGWHIPTDLDWKILEGAVDSLYGIGDPVWNSTNWRGSDVGKKLKSTSGWAQFNGNNTFGMNLFPAGYCYQGFYGVNYFAMMWTSKAQNGSDAYLRRLGYDHHNSYRGAFPRHGGSYVRCIHN